MREAEERLQQEVGTYTTAAILYEVINGGGRHQLSSPLLSIMAEAAARDQTLRGCPGTAAFAAATRMAAN